MPSWLSGAARSLDLFGQFDEYNDSPSTEAADAKALFCDWCIVGDTLLATLDTLRREPPQTQTASAED